eukprot:Hpha_TRINITY_DN15264_c0_g1::TRINITY_DN15264_c0_g1_i2::g.66048::m.66048/K02969/RP-S20e, RPS20; small subunit ribosomal protein S20e
MSGYPPVKKPQQQQDAQVNHKIRITLSSTKVQPLEKVCAELLRGAKEQQLRAKGPMRMPTKVLRHHTMCAPCGEGTITWDHFQLRVHKRVIDLVSPAETVKKITTINIEPGVDVEVTVADA